MKKIFIACCIALCGGLLSCGEDDETPGAAVIDLNLDVDLILGIVNENRTAGAVCGEETKVAVSALIWSDELALAALNHSNDMESNNYFDHTSQDGRSFSERAKEAGFTGSPVGENIARGFDSEQRVMQGWMGSPGHCRNIMTSNATHIGIARSGEDAIWTMVLGKQ